MQSRPGRDGCDLSPHTPRAFGHCDHMRLFAYGARTIFLAAGLGEAEGRLIVDRLRKRLPSTAAV